MEFEEQGHIGLESFVLERRDWFTHKAIYAASRSEFLEEQCLQLHRHPPFPIIVFPRTKSVFRPNWGDEAREHRSLGMMPGSIKPLLDHTLQPRHTPGRVFHEHALGIDADMPPVSNVFHEQSPEYRPQRSLSKSEGLSGQSQLSCRHHQSGRPTRRDSLRRDLLSSYAFATGNAEDFAVNETCFRRGKQHEHGRQFDRLSAAWLQHGPDRSQCHNIGADTPAR